MPASEDKQGMKDKRSDSFSGQHGRSADYCNQLQEIEHPSREALVGGTSLAFFEVEE
jgi:hypothetical protein